MSEHKQREDRLAILEGRFAQLEQIFDTNTAVFIDSLQLAELCINALQRALDDMLKDGPIYPTTKIVTVDGLRRIDFKAYLKDAMEQKMDAKIAPDGGKVPEDGQVVFEFGG